MVSMVTSLRQAAMRRVLLHFAHCVVSFVKEQLQSAPSLHGLCIVAASSSRVFFFGFVGFMASVCCN